MVVASCGGGGFGPACRELKVHQPPGSSYVSDTVLFSREWHTFYSSCLLICIVSKWLNVMFMFRAPLFICGYSGQQCCVKDVSSVSILKWKAHIPRKKPGGTHIHAEKLVVLAHLIRTSLYSNFWYFPERISYSSGNFLKERNCPTKAGMSCLYRKIPWKNLLGNYRKFRV